MPKYNVATCSRLAAMLRGGGLLVDFRTRDIATFNTVTNKYLLQTFAFQFFQPRTFNEFFSPRARKPA